MTQIRFAALAAGLLLAAVLVAQPDTPRPTTSLYTTAMYYVHNKELHEALKLKPEQVKKLEERQKEFLDQRLVNATDLEKFLKDTLTAEQVQRLREITLEQTVRRFGPSRLVRIPEAVEALKLTDEQKTRLSSREALDKVLTEAQMKTWKSLTGSPLEVTLVQAGQPGGFPDGFGAPRLPVPVRYLKAPDVQKELKLTKDQETKLAEAEAKFTEAMKDSRNWTREERATKLAAAQKDLSEKVSAVLDAGQNKRLAQIDLQRVKKATRPAAFFTEEKVEQGLALTEAQKEKLAAVGTEAAKQVPVIVLADEPVEKITSRLDEVHKGTYDRMVAALTDQQRAKLKDLLGEPFEGSVTAPRPDRPPVGPTARAFGRTTEFLYLREEKLQKELGMSAEQAKKIRTHELKWSEESNKGLPTTPERTKALSDISDKAVADILDAKQAKRFRQIILQSHEKAGGLGAVVKYSGVAEELKLTEEQRGRLDKNEDAAKVLTDAQKEAVKGLLGEPYKEPLVLGGPPEGWRSPADGRVSAAKPADLHYATQKSVQEELKLTEDQKTKLAEADKAFTDATRAAAGLSAAERRQKQAEAVTAAEKAVTAALKAEQTKRLAEIALQQDLKRTPTTGLATVLAGAKASAALELTADQRASLRTVSQNATQVRNLVYDQGLSQDDEAKLLADLKRVQDERTLKVLTAEQQKTWKEMLGKPFEGEVTPLRPGFGDRGPGGIGGPGGGVTPPPER